MIRQFVGALALVLVAAVGPLPSFAQAVAPSQTPSGTETSNDWEIRRDPRNKLLVAFTTFDNGLAIAARCTDGSYEVAIGGLPAVTTAERSLRIGFRGDPLHDEQWFVTTGQGVAISQYPAPFARQLRDGGRLDIVVPGGAEGGRNLRYVIDLPTSASAVDETLTACSRPLADLRDRELTSVPEGGLPSGISWAARPQPQYPGLISSNGFVTLTCLTRPDGHVRDCVIEAEYPARGGFGRATLQAMTASRLQNTADPSAPLPVRMISFIVRFCVEGFCTGQRPDAPTGTHIQRPVLE